MVGGRKEGGWMVGGREEGWMDGERKGRWIMEGGRVDGGRKEGGWMNVWWGREGGWVDGWMDGLMVRGKEVGGRLDG